MNHKRLKARIQPAERNSSPQAGASSPVPAGDRREGPLHASKKVLWVLGGGFALTILLLLGSAWIAIEAIDTIEARSEALLAQHRISSQVIDEIQGEEASLSDLFYALVAGPVEAGRGERLARLDGIAEDVERTLESARNETTVVQWDRAKVAVERFLMEVREVAGSTPGDAIEEPPASLYHAHEALVGAISGLVSANYETAIGQERREAASHRQQLQQALGLLGVAVVLAVVCALTTVRIANRMYLRTAWQARELSRLSQRVIVNQEDMLQRFSRELHDEFGQSLTAIEANLAAVPIASPEVASRIEDCSLLVKDLMSNVRELSQLLRPSTLDDFGLKPSLEWLMESFAQRTGIRVNTALNFEGRLTQEAETSLFRIAQEALTNVTRHSKATEIEVRMAVQYAAGDPLKRRSVRLSIADDGGGMKPSPQGRGLGLAGMRERMRMSGGTLQIESDSRGVTVVAEVMLDETAQRAETHPNPVGG